MTLEEKVAEARSIQEEKTRRMGGLVPDPATYIRNNIMIENPQKKGDTRIPFDLWPEQVKALKLLDKVSRITFLKARQLGISWTVLAWIMIQCMFKPGISWLVLSKEEEAAVEIIRRIYFMYDALGVKPIALASNRRPKTEVVFANGSRIKSFPTTENSATSFTASGVFIDEADKISTQKIAENLYTSVSSTVADGGSLIVVATAYGSEDWRLGRRLWNMASDDPETLGIYRHFIPWYARVERTKEWYKRQEAVAISPAHHRREFPEVPEDALNFKGVDYLLQDETKYLNGFAEVSKLQASPEVVALDGAVKHDWFGMVSLAYTGKDKLPSVKSVKVWVPKDGEIIHQEAYDYIEAYIRTNNVRCVVYDETQLAAFGQQLRNRGIDAREFGQQKKRLLADTELFRSLNAGLLRHANNPELTESIKNANFNYDGVKRLGRIVKRSESAKIDLAVCLSMGYYTLTIEEQELKDQIVNATTGYAGNIGDMFVIKDAATNPFSAKGIGLGRM